MANHWRTSTTYAPSFQLLRVYTPCSIDQCEDARPGELLHTPPFQPSRLPSRTPPLHRHHSPVYSQHSQGTGTARYTTALRHRPGLPAHASSHSSITLPSHQWQAIDDRSSPLRRIRTREPIPLIGPLPFKADALLSHLVGELAGTLAQVDRYPFPQPRDHIEQICFLTHLTITPEPGRHTRQIPPGCRYCTFKIGLVLAFADDVRFVFCLFFLLARDHLKRPLHLCPDRMGRPTRAITIRPRHDQAQPAIW